MSDPTSLADQFLALHQRASHELSACTDDAARLQLRQRIIGRKGELASLFEQLGTLTGAERAEAGKTANHIRESLYALFGADVHTEAITDDQFKQSLAWKRSSAHPGGHPHPVREFLQKVQNIFLSLGYDICDSGELEDETHNFDLLNIPKDHPARDAWDTFFVSQGRSQNILRTHTSPMQIRTMQKRKPPVRIIIPGRVFRHEATDASHSATFYQCEGFCIDTKITLTDLMGTLSAVLKSLYGDSAKIRFRPHHYPFVEPGMDVDMLFTFPGKEPQWLEMLGSGMIHPTVLKSMGINPTTHSGFAFGLGIDRLAMLWYGITDIRDLYSPSPAFIRTL